MKITAQLTASFGTRVRNLREAKGFSQEGLADAIGIDRTYVSGIERGKRNPTLMMIYRISQALKVQPAQLLSKTTLRARR